MVCQMCGVIIPQETFRPSFKEGTFAIYWNNWNTRKLATHVVICMLALGIIQTKDHVTSSFQFQLSNYEISGSWLMLQGRRGKLC